MSILESNLSKELVLGFQREYLKKKYPEKKVILYSTESAGNRFHEALRKVDDFLYKNIYYPIFNIASSSLELVVHILILLL